MRKELSKQYDPKLVEGQIYDMWTENDCFKAEPDPNKKPYSIVMPPPNVTGQLHMGHALDSTLQDILTRYKRMHIGIPQSDTEIGENVEARLIEQQHQHKCHTYGCHIWHR